MTKRAGSRPPRVSLASPVAQPPSVRHSSRIWGPPARWMAPSTPPPPSSVVLAAFTITSVAWVVMSPRTSSTVAPAQSRRRTLARYHRRPRQAILELRPRPPRAPDGRLRSLLASAAEPVRRGGEPARDGPHAVGRGAAPPRAPGRPGVDGRPPAPDRPRARRSLSVRRPVPG